MKAPAAVGEFVQERGRQVHVHLAQGPEVLVPVRLVLDAVPASQRAAIAQVEHQVGARQVQGFHGRPRRRKLRAASAAKPAAMTARLSDSRRR